MAKKPEDYEKLRAIWYKKLQKEGFKDIEQDEDNLKEWSTKFFLNHDKTTREAKESYYSMATQFLNEYNFESNLDKVIWEYHANAMSVREIAETLRKAKIIKRTGAWVHEFVVKRLRKIMKKMYMRE